MIEKPRRFDLYPDDFIAGVAGELTPSEMGVYSMVILLCYSHGGSIPDDLDWLRSKFKRRGASRVVSAAVERLVKLGKLTRACGELSSSRTRAEHERALSRLRASREHGARGGRPSNKNNDEAKGLGFPARVNNHHTSYSSNPVADATGADAPSFDPVKEIFERGLRILGAGRRSLLGKFRKRHGDVVVLEAICACEQYLPSEPVGFFVRCCEEHTAQTKRQSPATTLWQGAYNAGLEWDARQRDGNRRDGRQPDEPLLDSRRPPLIP